MKIRRNRKSPVAGVDSDNNFDKTGSWTGVPTNGDKKPTQDADDL